MRTVMVMVILLGMFNLVPLSTSIAQQAPSCDGTTLPASIRDLLKSKFPQWRPKQVSDMDADDQQLWSKAHEKDCPGIAVGHFEGGNGFSYATLLVPKSEPTGGYKLVVFSEGLNGDAYPWKLLDHADGQTYSGLVISRAKPGKYSDFERTKSVETKLDGVYVEWIEKGADLYYWSAGRYHKLRVSD